MGVLRVHSFLIAFVTFYLCDVYECQVCMKGVDHHYGCLGEGALCPLRRSRGCCLIHFTLVLGMTRVLGHDNCVNVASDMLCSYG